MINIGLIGYGYWGPNLVRNFAESNAFQVVWVADTDPNRLNLATKRFPGISTTTDAMTLIASPNVDVVVVATPVSTHFPLGMAALQAGKHLFMEKPLTRTVEEAEKLVDEAKRRGLHVMVDFTFIYTPSVAKIRELIQSDELGKLHYYDSIRINLGLFQKDVDVIWDLAVHDIAIMQDIFSAPIQGVSATGISHVPGHPENLAYITLFFDNNLIGHVNVNWLAPVKVRQVLVCGDKKMIIWDDVEPSLKVKVYDRNIEVSPHPESLRQALISYRSGDMWAPHLSQREALGLAIEHFGQVLQGNATLRTDGEMGLKVVKTLNAATVSLRNRGKLIEF